MMPGRAIPTDHTYWGSRLRVPRRYLAAILIGNLAWEFAQLPLYTIWYEGTAGEIAFAALHCTAGDVLIAAAALLAPVVIAGGRRWPHARYWSVGVMAVVIGLAYTVFSEWLNTEIRGSWAYAEWMPRLPLVGTGISPLLQWMIVPPLALLWAWRGIARAGHGERAAFS